MIKDKSYCYCYDMKLVDKLIKLGFRDRIIGAGNGDRNGDSYIVFFADNKFWNVYDNLKTKGY